MSWTEARTDRLKELYAEGRSGGYIARDLGGITRNAVIGKIYRLGLRPTPDISAKPRLAKVVRNRYAHRVIDVHPTTVPLPELKSESEVVPESQRKSVMELTARDCRFPFGDPGDADFYFCGAHAVPTLPYCAHHCRIAYAGIPVRRDRVRVR